MTGTARGAAPIYQDEFQKSNIDTQWTWQNPGDTSSYSLSRGRLTLSVGRGSDQWIGTDRAPRLLKDQPSDTWTVETRILANTGHGSTLAGLVIFRDAANWVIWGHFGDTITEAAGLIGNASTGPIAKMATSFPYLRIRRVGRVYSFDASLDGRHWTNGNAFDDRTGALDGAKIGLMGKTWGKRAAYAVRVDYYREYDVDLMPTVIKGIVSTELVAQQTGELSANETHLVDFCGGDLGEMFDWNGQTYIAFGDTFGCTTPKPWRANTLAFTTDTTPEDGLLFDGWVTDSQGQVQQLFGPEKGAITAIPTGAIGTPGAAYLFYMQVTDWKKWTCNVSSIASAPTEDPNTWTKHLSTVKWGVGNFNMVAVLQQGTTVYLFGTPCGRAGSIKLMKVERHLILQKNAYRYFSGVTANGPTWSSNEAAAITIAGGPAGEISVRWNAFLKRFVMAYLDEPKGLMVVREAPDPWGPWSAPIPIAHYDDYPKMYGAFMKDGFEENGGESLYFMMSIHGPYNAFWMKTTFAR